MILSKKGIDFIARQEGYNPNIYLCPSGHLTIGVGHQLSTQEVKSGIILIKGQPCVIKNGLSTLQIELLFDQDTDYFETLISQHVKVPLNQNQFDALVSFSFNLPVKDFLKSTLLKKLNEKNYADVPKQLERWVYAYNPKSKKKSPLLGLIRRRREEAKLWRSTY